MPTAITAFREASARRSPGDSKSLIYLYFGRTTEYTASFRIGSSPPTDGRLRELFAISESRAALAEYYLQHFSFSNVSFRPPPIQIHIELETVGWAGRLRRAPPILRPPASNRFPVAMGADAERAETPKST